MRSLNLITKHRYFAHEDFPFRGIHEFQVVEQTDASIKIKHADSGYYSVYLKKELAEKYKSFEDLGRTKVKR